MSLTHTLTLLGLLLAPVDALAQAEDSGEADDAGGTGDAGGAATPDIAEDADFFEPEGEPGPVLDVSGRLHVLYDRRIHDERRAAGSLSLHRARFQLAWHPIVSVETQLGVELAEDLPELLDAFVEVEATEFLSFRAGHRKVPFSAARLESAGDLRPILRGEYVRLLSGDVAGQPRPVSRAAPGVSLDYAGRKVGADVLLRFRRLARLELDVGVSQGEEGAADPVGRASVRIVKGLRVSAGATVIRTPTPPDPAFWAKAFELDVDYDRKRWRVFAEGTTGTNWLDPDRAWFFGFTGLVAYEIRLGPNPEPSIEPLVRFELVDETTRHSCNETMGLTAGATLRTLEVLRIQLNVEHLERPARAPNGEACPDTTGDDETTLLAQIAFDV